MKLTRIQANTLVLVSKLMSEGSQFVDSDSVRAAGFIKFTGYDNYVCRVLEDLVKKGTLAYAPESSKDHKKYILTDSGAEAARHPENIPVQIARSPEFIIGACDRCGRTGNLTRFLGQYRCATCLNPADPKQRATDFLFQKDTQGDYPEGVGWNFYREREKDGRFAAKSRKAGSNGKNLPRVRSKASRAG